MVVIPFRYDQFENAENVVNQGYGERLNIKTLTTEALLNSIRKV